VAVAENICEDPILTAFPVAAGAWLAQTGLEFLLTVQFLIVDPTAFDRVAETVSEDPSVKLELKKFWKF